ncbi:ATP-binding domain-containing protein [Salinimicrobium sp. 3283s]|uniref:DEAD/DEAH box helicase n=1 Tax=Salinimicrobium sp. 3283s TaxID=3114359 RepID=UPI0031EC9CEA
MENALFYNHVKISAVNKEKINLIENYCKAHLQEQIYLISSPLGEKYTYPYEDKVIIILSPKHKIMVIDLFGDKEAFETFFEDFIEDLSSISDKFEYKEHIGRSREWKKNNIIKVNGEKVATEEDLEKLLSETILPKELQRISELLISLLIGSINDIEKIGAAVPETLLEKVKKNIVLFDGDQTRFIYKQFNNKTVSIQGLSGTGKTELLLHKLKDIYIKDDKSKIFFTCHNIALANTLKARVPTFFNFMKVEKQIEWNKRLWVNRAWGSRGDWNSGLYSYLCAFYSINFLRYSYNTNYTTIFSEVLKHLNSIEQENFEYAFDYILIDERQDFPKVFFDVCEKVTRKKVFVAGDIFQDIFDNVKEDDEHNVDVVLNRCYRTDPRTLMFAHAIGMGLFEKKKINWFKDDEWKIIGYEIERLEGREIRLSREPIRRFEDLDLEDLESVVIKETTRINDVLGVLKQIKDGNKNINPDDIGIIFLDDSKEIYAYIDNLISMISREFNWKVNRAYENKEKIHGTVYLSNPNNVKGLEFPYVICITGAMRNKIIYRNILYTMLTRSFIQSYLMITNMKNKEALYEGLRLINENRYIKTDEPTDEEKEDIKNRLVKFKQRTNISYDEFLTNIFNELEIDKEKRHTLKQTLLLASIEKFNKAETVEYIRSVQKFF